MPTLPRTVSLLPSATEMVALLGGLPALVGRSHECDFPLGVESLPILTASRLAHASGPIDAAEIDRQVRSQLEAGSLYTLDEAKLTALGPELILTQDLCSVCSVDLNAVRRVAERLTPAPRVLSLNPETIEGVLDDLWRVGEAMGLSAEGVIVQLRERLAQAIDYVNPFADGPTVAFLEWTDPLFIGGHWTPQLIERAGGRHPLNPTAPVPGSGAAIGPQQASRRAGKSIRVPAEVLAASRPDVVFIAPCGLSLAQIRPLARELARQPWFRALPAFKAGRVALVDGSQMFNRPGPRLVDAQEFLVGYLNDRPELIPPGFPWEPLNASGL
ncbi:MAG: cobalamin-binding protein [Planctomycetota bacterium]|nr:cobalamin-binding protein [Planctomycetota bacterium]